MSTKKRVVVAMSGGVDSSLAAALLLEQGYEVIGVTMQIWPDLDDPMEEIREHGGCCSIAAVNDARKVANTLGIPYYVLNFKQDFAEKVIDYFVEEYAAGRTPNPCIACNRYVKFEMLLSKALGFGAEYLATGHYARIWQDPVTGRFALKKAADPRKDQTYALYNLTQEQIGHTLFPLGDLTKAETREMARNYGLSTAEKPESQEICFVLDDDYAGFVARSRPSAVRPGPFLDTSGGVLGTHRGIPYYTIGQRKGLGLALGTPMYVVDIDPERNAVVLGTAEEVFGNRLVADDLNWMAFERPPGEIEAAAKIRYTAKETACRIVPTEGDRVRVEFYQPVRAITPGQAVVFYDGDLVLGGGTIVRS